MTTDQFTASMASMPTVELEKPSAVEYAEATALFRCIAISLGAIGICWSLIVLVAYMTYVVGR